MAGEKRLSGTALKRKQGAMAQLSAIAAKTEDAVANETKKPQNAQPITSNTIKDKKNENAADTPQKKDPVKHLEKTDGMDAVPEGQESRVIWINDADLLDDPLNEDYYGSLDGLENLAASMKEYGFQGVILAYPFENGKYRIESGHRRRAAGRMAGLSKFPVLPTEPPKTEWERRLRLFRGNLHNRKEKPMTVARVAQGLFEARSEEIRYKKANGLIKEGEQTYANALVAADLDISTSLVEKYRKLNSLSPVLQEMADDGDAPWSELSACSTLSEDAQLALAAEIRSKEQSSGETSVDRKWMKKTVAKIRETDPAYAAPRKERTRDDYALFMKGARNVREALDYGKGFRGSERQTALAELRELKTSVEKAIEELSGGE